MKRRISFNNEYDDLFRQLTIHSDPMNWQRIAPSRVYKRKTAAIHPSSRDNDLQLIAAMIQERDRALAEQMDKWLMRIHANLASSGRNISSRTNARFASLEELMSKALRAQRAEGALLTPGTTPAPPPRPPIAPPPPRPPIAPSPLRPPSVTFQQVSSTRTPQRQLSRGGGIANLGDIVAARVRQKRKTALLQALAEGRGNAVEQFMLNYGYEDRSTLMKNLDLANANMRPATIKSV